MEEIMPDENGNYTAAELEAARQEGAKAALAREKAQRENYVHKDEHEKILAEARENAQAELFAEAEKYNTAEEKFIAAGGNQAAFDDFYNSATLDFENDSTLEKSIAQMKEQKGYMFGGAAQAPTDNQESKDDDSEYYPGTLQKKPKI